jgi:Zn-dependent protease with chaperone function
MSGSTTARRVLQLVLVLVLFGLARSAGAAELRHTANEAVVDGSVKDVTTLLPESGLPIPGTLKTPRDVYLIATAGAAYFEVYALARPEAPAIRVAQTLNDALAGTVAEPKRIRYDTADGYSAAVATASRGHLGTTSAAMDAPIGRVADAFRAAGFVPHVLLRMPRYAESPALGPASYHTRHFLWYDRTTAPSEPVRVSSRIPPSHRAAGLVALFLGALMIPFWFAALYLATRGRGSLFDRKELSYRLLVFGCGGVVLLQGLLMLGFASTETARLAADLWFGASNPMPFWNAFAMGIPVLLVTGLVSDTLERTVYKMASEAPPPMSVAEKRLRNRATLISLLVMGAFFAVEYFYVMNLPRDNPLRHQFRIALWVLFPFVFWGVPWWIERKKAQLTQHPAGPEVAPAAREAARSADVRVDESRDAWNTPGVTVERDGTVVVSRRLADALTPEEMRFAVAQAVAEAPRLRRWMRLTYAIAFLPGIWPALYLSVLRKPMHLPAAWDALTVILPAFVAMAPALLLVRSVRKRHVILADREALRATGSARVAERALATLLREWETGEPHPGKHWAWRFQALRESALDLGLTGR